MDESTEDNSISKEWYLEDFFHSPFIAKEMGMSRALFFKKANRVKQMNPRPYQYRFSEEEEKKLDDIKRRIISLLLKY